MIEEIVTENDHGAGVVKSWASIIDDNTREQATLISRSNIVEGHLALMPDAHFGYGPPVGTALRTRDGVMPYAVGVDIGCGMIAAETTLKREQLIGHEGAILEAIREMIPSGVGRGHDGAILNAADAFVEEHGFPKGLESGAFDAGRVKQMRKKIKPQFGTLGAGNHFVEVCDNDEGTVWLLLHSGSRGIGNMLATGHQQRARAFCGEKKIPLEHQDMAYFPMGSAGADIYLLDMVWAQEYAFKQREAMMDNLISAVEMSVDDWDIVERINCHHNYAELQEDGAWLTRKGAIDASEGVPGIIPGSMGAATYIVRGKGNEEAYRTSPHGAGRVLSRNAARRTLSEDEFRTQMEGRTWLDRDAAKLLDEAPGAYKPIEQVMKDSQDLVETVAVLGQFINYKGL
ncbi:MAG: RtcB family protein [Chloroflexi bacterium]|nr:RtcB family protein [Chloroflexota bacterium]